MYKKAYELSILCDMDVNIQIYDRTQHKLIEFSTNLDHSSEKLMQFQNDI